MIVCGRSTPSKCSCSRTLGRRCSNPLSRVIWDHQRPVCNEAAERCKMIHHLRSCSLCASDPAILFLDLLVTFRCLLKSRCAAGRSPRPPRKNGELPRSHAEGKSAAVTLQVITETTWKVPLAIARRQDTGCFLFRSCW